MKKHLFVFIKIIGFFALWILLLVLQSIPAIGEPVFTKGYAAFQRFWWELLPLVSVIIVTIIFAKIIEKNTVKINMFHKMAKNSILGVIIGIEWIGIPILILSVLGFFHPGTFNNVSFLFVWVFAAFLNVIMQEYLVRGYVFELLKKEYNLIASIIVTTLIFLLFHAGAFEAGIIAVLNVVTMSIFMSLLLIYAKSLFLPIVVHAVWNIIGSLLGCVSLADDYPVLINCVIAGDKVISGGKYKLEGSVFVLVINVVNIIVLIILINRRKSR